MVTLQCWKSTDWRCYVKGNWKLCILIAPFVWIFGVLVSLCTLWILVKWQVALRATSAFRLFQVSISCSRLKLNCPPVSGDLNPGNLKTTNIYSGILSLELLFHQKFSELRSQILRQDKHVIMNQEQRFGFWPFDRVQQVPDSYSVLFTAVSSKAILYICWLFIED